MSVDERVQDELEALEAILMDDISISYDANGHVDLVKSTIFPSTANEVDKQYVCITLEINLPEGYPDSKPIVKLKSPRGLDDSTIDHIRECVNEKCDEFLGQPVIYELIELIKENLTKSNLPTCQCAVCLYGFCEGDIFTKTHCFHYFHSYCLARHIIVTEKHYNEEQEKLPAWKRDQAEFQVTCPVCREPISLNVNELKTAPPPKDLESAQKFELTYDLKKLQEQMRSLFNYQKSRGGIIDIEAEENKLLLITNSNEEGSDNSTSTCMDAGPSISGPVQVNIPENVGISKNHRHYSKYTNHR